VGHQPGEPAAGAKADDGHGLDSYCPDVRMLAGVGGVSSAARALIRSGPEDLLIALAFPRYLTDTVTLAQRARGRGMQVLAITDRPSSPLAPQADVALYAQTSTRYRPNCETAALALVEALTSAVALRAPDAFQVAGRVVEFAAPWLHGAPGLRTVQADPTERKRTP
jgi:DNA-binding MurR/RpiR family transcriptional regulator